MGATEGQGRRRVISRSDEKAATYTAMVESRKACRACAGLTNPSECVDGQYDSDQIGPWGLWQGNLNADVMVVGQDWGDTTYFVTNAGRDTAKNPTNQTLRHLLSIAGIDVDLPSARDSGAGAAFFTSAILCLKQGGMQAKLDPAWLANCGHLFLRPTIELIAPRVLVTLGEQAYRAVCQAHGFRALPFRRAVEGQGVPLPSGPLLRPVYHCGARILNTHRPLAMQERDWDRVRDALRTPRTQSVLHDRDFGGTRIMVSP